MKKRLITLVIVIIISISFNRVFATSLEAGVAKINITKTDIGLVNDSLYVRALVLNNDKTNVAIISLDVVAVGEIGYIANEYLGDVRKQLKKELNLDVNNVIINTTHCHGVPVSTPDVEKRTVAAVKQVMGRMVPVNIGVGVGYEDRIMINRRLKLKNGREWDERHAYSLPPDEDVVAVGPIDPEIGVLRVDRKDGRTFAVLYNFAMHPIIGAASHGNTADIIGFSSKVIEDNLSTGAIAMFIQGCAGDIKPVYYKDVAHPRDAEPLGNMLGLSTLSAVRKIETKNDNRLKVVNKVVELPRANVAERIKEMETERLVSLDSLKGTSLNLKTFINLTVNYSLSPKFPSYYSYEYLHQQQIGRKDLVNLVMENRYNMEQYMRNIHTMEKLTIINTNLELLRNHQKDYETSKTKTVPAELVGLRIGNFVLTTFPGELFVQIGLDIKKKSPYKYTFVAGYTNGYLYYTPTEEQLKNVGRAQEDIDCMLAPGCK